MHKTNAIIILWLIGIASVTHSFGQEKYLQKKVSGDFTNERVDNILDNLAQQCRCYFSYNVDIIDATKQVNYWFSNQPLSSVLDSLFSDSIYFNEFRNQIIFVSKSDTTAESAIVQHNFINLSGIIVDSANLQPLPFVTVAIAGEFYGTVSNLQGVFSLKIPERFKNSNLEFSSIGYYNKSIEIASFKSGQSLKMSAAVVSLQEVMVRSVGATLLLRKALAKIEENYYSEPYNYTAFYRESIRKNDKYFTYSEALLKGYKSKMKLQAMDKMVLEKSRKYLKVNESDTLLVKLKGGIDACLRLDIIRQKPDFIDAQCEQLYDYALNDVKVWEDKLVHVLAFKPKAGAIDAYFEGELYIGVDDIAIQGAEFMYSPQMLGKIKKSLVLRKSSGIKVKPLSTKYFLKYKQRNNKYFIQHVRGEMTLKAKQRKQLKYANYYTSLEMIATNIDTFNVEKPNRKTLVKTQTIFLEYNAPNLKGFWEYNNTIVPEKNILNAFNKSGFRLEEEH